jgi:hypothetical protein
MIYNFLFDLQKVVHFWTSSINCCLDTSRDDTFIHLQKFISFFLLPHATRGDWKWSYK